MSTTTVGLTDAERELRRLGIGGSDVPASNQDGTITWIGRTWQPCPTCWEAS